VRRRTEEPVATGSGATPASPPSWRVPFNRAFESGKELELVGEAMAGGHIAGGGRFTARAEALLGEILGGRSRALLTTSCTHALELAALLLEVGPGDEVVLPSFTFVSVANAFVLRGARPVFVDCRRDTLNIDESLVPAAIGPRTRAVVAMHYAGVGCDLAALARATEERGVPLVEDAAHGLFGSWCGRPLGTVGRLATLSFHETKNVSCGEGGALVVNDPELVARAEVLREKGTDRSRFQRGEVDKYRWIDVGSSWVLSELLAAFLLAQLEARERIQTARRRIWQEYAAALAGWAAAHGTLLPRVPDDCGSAYHLFHLLLPTPAARDGLMAHLRSRGILAVFHYLPLHDSPMGRRFGYRRGDLPVAEWASERLLRLPLFASLDPASQEHVIAAVLEFSA